MKMAMLALLSIPLVSFAQPNISPMSLMPSEKAIYLRSDGSTVVTYTVTSNVQSARLTKLSIDPAFEGGNAASFSLQNDTCSGTDLHPLASCSFELVISGQNQPTEFTLSPRACANNGTVCAQSLSQHRPAVTVAPVTHAVRAYVPMLNNILQIFNVATGSKESQLGGFCFNTPCTMEKKNTARMRHEKAHGKTLAMPDPMYIGTAVSLDGNTFYVADNDSNQISIVDVSGTPKIKKTLPVGNSPVGIAVMPNQEKIYVCNQLDGAIWDLDGTTFALQDIIHIPGHPTLASLSPDGSTLFIRDLCITYSIYIYNTRDNSQITTLSPDSQLGYAEVSPDGSKLFVSDYHNNKITVYSTADYTSPLYEIAPCASCTGPLPLAFSPDGTRLYVGYHDSSMIGVIDTATQTFITSFSVNDRSTAISLSPDGTKLYLVGDQQSAVTIIDTTQLNAPPTVVPLDAQPNNAGFFIG